MIRIDLARLLILATTLALALGLVPLRAEDSREKIDALRQRAEQGELDARFELGRAFLRGEIVPRDLTEAKRLLEPAAATGHAEAMGAYGFMLARGLGVEVDAAAGFDLIRRAADGGVVTARLNQGIMMMRGQGTPADVPGGLALITQAAEAGLVEAQARLAEAYYLGEEGRVPKSDEAAAPWALKAADAGHAWAQNLVGTMKEHGLGMEQDPGGAEAYYRRAANQGDAKAQSALGRLLHNGVGIAPDRPEAYYWLRASAEQGEVTARNFFAEVEAGFSEEERQAGEQRLRDAPPPTTRRRPGPGPPIPRATQSSPGRRDGAKE